MGFSVTGLRMENVDKMKDTVLDIVLISRRFAKTMVVLITISPELSLVTSYGS